MTAHPPAWHEARRRGIGGSDVAAILGLSKFKTAYQVYQEKTGALAPQPDNDRMFWGRRLEPVVRQVYADQTGRDIVVPDTALRHPDHDYMLANLDGIAAGDRVLEIKTAGQATGWGEAGSAQIPDHYALQVQHYMAVTGLPVADVAVLIGGSDFRIYVVPADPVLQSAMIEAEAAFWRRVVERRPPEPLTMAEAQHRFGRSAASGNVEADANAIAAVQNLHDLRRQIATLEERATAERAAIMKALGEAGDTLVANGVTLATWKLAKGRKLFDAKSFAAAHPDLHAAFTRPGTPSRTFLLKD